MTGAKTHRGIQSSSNMKNLKYLFEVRYADEEIYRQSPEDKSKIDPEKRSEFYDVLQEVEKGKTIRMFSLIEQDSDKPNILTVDLGTGLFYVNGVMVILESTKLPTIPDKFELVFYRQWTQSVNVDYKKSKEGVMKVIGNTPVGEAFCEYFIGWKCNIAGKEYVQKIGVA